MRSIPFFLFILTITGHMTLFGQEILNSGFEDWTNIQYFEDPDEYSTSNTVTYFGGSESNVTKTTDAQSGNYAIRLETINTPDGVLEGAALIGEPGAGTFTGGIPYGERPDSLTGYVKYDINTADTAYVAAVFKKFGVPIGITFAQFTGVQNDYLQFSVPIEWLVPVISPDTLAIALISSSIFTEPVAGNVLYVDNVQFVGPGDPFPNGDFENWTFYSSDEPDNWQSTNIFTMPASSVSLSKTNDSHSGNFAAKLESRLTNWNDTLAFITNGTVGEGGPVGGMPVEDIPETLSGYYKYEPTGPDSAIISVTLYHYNTATGNSDVLDETIIKLPATDTYTYFEVNVDYYSLPEPDTVNIAFGSGNFNEPGAYLGLGSALYLDDVEITYKPHIVAIKDNPGASGPKVFPNPVSKQLFFEFVNPSVSVDDIILYNRDGKIVYNSHSRHSGKFSVQVDQLPAGLYFYQFKAGQQTFEGKFIKQ